VPHHRSSSRIATSKLIVEALTDGKWARLGFIAVTPLLLLVGLFFIIVIITDSFQALAPLAASSATHDSSPQSGQVLPRAYSEGFTPPPITIQMPVYKEGLEGVIKPTINSLKEAISHTNLTEVCNHRGVGH